MRSNRANIKSPKPNATELAKNRYRISFRNESHMRFRTATTRSLRQDWPWLLALGVMLAVPACFTVPLSLAIAGYTLGVLMFIGSVLFFGRGYILWDALPSLLVVTIIAVLSQVWRSANEKEKELEKKQEHPPVVGIPLANNSSALDAAMSISLHFGAHWRRASEAGRSALLHAPRK